MRELSGHGSREKQGRALREQGMKGEGCYLFIETKERARIVAGISMGKGLKRGVGHVCVAGSVLVVALIVCYPI